MHADDTIYGEIGSGIITISGNAPAIRIDDNKLVIRDGPRETPPLILTRAQASRKLRHIILCGNAGGYLTIDALRWLRDTRVAVSALDWNGEPIFTSSPHGPDQPSLRRSQALICSGVPAGAAVRIARELLRVKIIGQAEIIGSMPQTRSEPAIRERADASVAISSLAAKIVDNNSGPEILTIERDAAALYWREWSQIPIKFARDNPQRLDSKGRWRAGRTAAWETFGPRASELTGKPWRATTPGNAVLNFLNAIAATEMTVALTAASLDPGIGLFHADTDNRPSLALDALEALRPTIEKWCLACFAATTFANRDFNETADGEVRLSRPLNS